ncbi:MULTISPECIES: FxsA family membrane protein [unclassified Streptomyces]|uniref:FxsA family membrane protein n=1 Tax=unclassified Streptomyces TaxID=2593676 RepID=UPI0022586B9C|nr:MULTISPECIES: FxsA family membrane protein [unclassified Streptomyces]MCX5138907.1 FxsA family protein [Streptomyces sp. NBC_00338]WRZ63614.1 FxsA family protein [Streptomyces sp. NBC_01257]WSU57579.1 FxsA family protein [Streptomyces sp. NBC_01104]
MTTGTPPPTARRRSRARTFVPLAIAAWAVLEIWLLIVVADAAGAFTVLLLLAAGVVLGAVVMKRAGRRAFRNLTETLQQMPGQPGAAGSSPAPSSTRGNGFLMLGGLLIMIPGMISDVAGLLLLVPPVRSALSRYTERSLERRMTAAAPGGLSDAFQQARMHRPDGKVVQGEVIREEPPNPTDPPRPPLTK